MDEQRTILLIEDSRSQALAFRLSLQREGYEVRVATDGDEGWQQACMNPPHLILLDINLPILDGFQVLTRLKCGRSTANIPVIMLTRCDYLSTVERAIALGADGYLFKDDCNSQGCGLYQICATVNQFLRPKTTLAA